MLKKLISLFKTQNSSLPNSGQKENNSRLFFGKSKNPPIIEITANTIISKIDIDSYLESSSAKEKKAVSAQYKAFKKAVKTAGRHRGVEAQRNKAKILDFVSFLIDKNYLIKIKK